MALAVIPFVGFLEAGCRSRASRRGHAGAARSATPGLRSLARD
jgi:hypothetical protein